MRFEFATATQIIFGGGTLKEIGSLAKDIGTRAFIVTGRDPARPRRLITLLKEAGVFSATFQVHGEPSVELVEAGVANAKSEKCDLVISFGGGSVLDAGKAIAAVLTNEGELLDYLEVIGRGKTLVNASAPFIAIPTTAGTGSEVTRNAVLASVAHRVKVSMRSPYMLPRVALVDPELAHGLPFALTASTGMDALTQLIEPYVCTKANPMVDGLCLEGIQRVARSLRKACEDPNDSDAREDMAMASLFGGLALANAGLGAVHGFAGPIGGMFPAPHGAVCAKLLPNVIATNLRALRERAPESEALRRYERVAGVLTGKSSVSPEDAIKWTQRLITELRIPRLGTYGINEEHIPEIVEKAERASSMKPNPIVLTRQELSETLCRAL